MTEILCPSCFRPTDTVCNQMAWDSHCLIVECQSCNTRLSVSIKEIPKMEADE